MAREVESGDPRTYWETTLAYLVNSRAVIDPVSKSKVGRSISLPMRTRLHRHLPPHIPTPHITNTVTNPHSKQQDCPPKLLVNTSVTAQSAASNKQSGQTTGP